MEHERKILESNLKIGHVEEKIYIFVFNSTDNW